MVSNWYFSKKLGFRWSYESKDGKRHLTKKAKSFLRQKAKEQPRDDDGKFKKKKVMLMKRMFVFSNKAEYDSERGSGHDVYLDIEYGIVATVEPERDWVQKRVEERLEAKEFETRTNAKDFTDIVPWKVEITGIESDEPTMEADGYEYMRVEKVGYHL